MLLLWFTIAAHVRYASWILPLHGSIFHSHFGTMTPRGCSDHLSDVHLLQLELGLRGYVESMNGRDLWQFGIYAEKLTGETGKSGEFTSKHAPQILDILRSRDLWKILLQFFPRSMMRDSDVALALRSLLSTKDLDVNNTGISDDLFITWFCKAAHLTLTHIRLLAQFPAKYRYRVSRLTPEQRKDYDEIIGMVNVDTQQSITPAASVNHVESDLDKKKVEDLVHEFLKSCSGHGPAQDPNSGITRRTAEHTPKNAATSYR